jgi:hypothetical protein
MGAAYEYLDEGDAEINQIAGPLQRPIKFESSAGVLCLSSYTY